MMSLESIRGDRRRLAAAGGAVLLLVLVLYFVLSSGGSKAPQPPAPAPVTSSSSAASSVSYALRGASTLAIPGGCETYSVTVSYVGGYAVRAVVMGDSYLVALWNGGVVGYSSGTVGPSAPAVARAYDVIVGVVGGSSLTLSSTSVFSVSWYTFSVSGDYLYVWWSGDGFAASLTCSVVSVGSPAVWVTFTTEKKEKKS